MNETMALKNYTDFDRLIVGKNLIITILGAILAFVLAYYEIYVEIPIPPYNLSFSIAVMVFVAVVTRNMASSMFVALVGTIGLVSPSDQRVVEFILGYILVNLLLLIILGYLADKLTLVMNWNKFYLWSGILFSTIFIGIGLLFNPYTDRYWDRGVKVGNGGHDLYTGTELPLYDLAILLALILFTFVIMFLIRGEIILNQKQTRKYKFWGIFFVLLGQLVSLIPFYLYSKEIEKNTLRGVAFIDRHINTVDDLFSHQISAGYGVIVEPLNIFFLMAITVTFTGIGLSLYSVGKHGGNLAGTRGGSNVVFYAAPIAFLLYQIFGSYYLQNFIDPNGFYFSIELFPLYATMIWAVYTINQLAARIVLFFYDLLFS